MIRGYTLKKIGSFLIKGIGKYFKYAFIFIFLLIPLLYAISISIQENDAQVGFEYFMPKLFEPLKIIHEESLRVIEQGGVVEDKTAFSNIFGFASFYWTMLGALWIYWKWIHLFGWIIKKTPWSDEADTFQTYSLAIFLVTTLEVIYLLATRDVNENAWDIIKLPFSIWLTFLKASPYFIQHANEAIGEPLGNATREAINNSMNNTAIVK